MLPYVRNGGVQRGPPLAEHDAPGTMGHNAKVYALQKQWEQMRDGIDHDESATTGWPRHRLLPEGVWFIS